MRLHQVFDQAEHDGMVIECFLQMWKHSADLMFIMAVEDKGEFTLFDNNPASKKVMGLDADLNVHRLDIRAIFGDEVTEQVYETYREVILAKKPISIEQNGIRGDGSSIYFDTLFVPIFSEQGEPLFVCGVSRDITKIKEAEQVAIKANEKLKEYSYALEEINQNLDKKVQERTIELENSKKIAEEALQAKSSFVARMSHEIRTPINAVIGLSDLALKTELDSNQKDFIGKILESGETLLELVNDVLDFSKMEAGKLLVERIPFSIEKIARRVCNMNSIKAEEKQLTFLCHIDEKVPKVLIGDPLRIQQIIVNLTSNAIKFTDHGEVCLRITSEEYEEQGILLQCEVSDTGIGISKEQIDRLFQSFSQADTSITRKFGGTGLGLSISQQLCELMGGQIHVSSEQGVGTKFTMSLPLFSGSTASHSTHKDPLDGLDKVESVPDLSGCRILLVDDHPINRHVAIGYLDETKASIDTAISGLQALKKLQEEEFDVVLLDIQMPEMDGFTVAKKIRNDLKLLTLPIIAMTAHVDESSIQDSYNSGMNDHIGKPVNKYVLYETLQKYLRVSIDNTKLDTDVIDISEKSVPSEYEALFVGIKKLNP
ncbi:ATP-binding protein [Marinomonas sp. 15G1-11]|uniref:histidine kinase n=1 Tax=Marinomonas phaeophyticola TaxID=3004091 RepID=A0ABT4JR11_9GAMM|nr:ATP-binding protein [Marinomonas sp. 15G1-11]MCZ2720778.1 ATP-binding protein [Marinomonas sp. 15G1-11]